MKVVVVGGTGSVGSKLVQLLLQCDHDAVTVSRATGFDVVTGAGLEETLAGADALVDVSDPRSRPGGSLARFHLRGTTELVMSARAAGIGHYVILSAAGVDLQGAGEFLLGKRQQESVLRASRLPFTIVRSPPLSKPLIDDARSDDSFLDAGVHPGDGRPVSVAHAAEALMTVLEAAPVNAIRELGGVDAVFETAIAERTLASIRIVQAADRCELSVGVERWEIAGRTYDHWARGLMAASERLLGGRLAGSMRSA
jgi:uncharacterized protein YbjT (DUF2867 family)